jgi:hypothetical protein
MLCEILTRLIRAMGQRRTVFSAADTPRTAPGLPAEADQHRGAPGLTVTMALCATNRPERVQQGLATAHHSALGRCRALPAVSARLGAGTVVPSFVRERVAGVVAAL